MRKDIIERKEEIQKWISENHSKAFICKEIKCKPDTLNGWLKRMGIEYKGNQYCEGYKYSPFKKTAIEYSKSSCVKSNTLKNKLIKDNIKKEKCELCGKTKWNKKKIPLELHHINGNHYDNDFSNLEILCPNCHYQREH